MRARPAADNGGVDHAFPHERPHPGAAEAIAGRATKLSYTTLACPDWTIDCIVEAAVASKYEAIDFRGYLGDTEVTDSPLFSGESLRETSRRIRDAGLEVSCLSSGARMTAADADDRTAQLDMVRRYAELCNALGCGMVRIFGGSAKGLADPVASAAEILSAAAVIARDAGIRIAVETHDDWTSTAMLRAALKAAGDPDGIGLLWDVMHPWHSSGEEPEVSAKNLAGKLLNTHWKDFAMSPDGKCRLCLVGEGELPMARILAALRGIGYDGWFTFEWEKRWHPEIEDPEVAIPAFAEFMRSIAARG